MKNSSLTKAFLIYGSQAKLARALGVEPMTVSQWKKHGVPAKRALQIEILTNGQVTRQDLRPDIFGLAALTHE